MNKVKITVLRTALNRDLADEYGVERLTACTSLREGQIFYADFAKPEGFCDEAWKTIFQYIFVLAHGAVDGCFFYGDWIRKPGTAICCCNDGIRPVIFKPERTNTPATQNGTDAKNPRRNFSFGDFFNEDLNFTSPRGRGCARG